jgi:hypothetical protein
MSRDEHNIDLVPLHATAGRRGVTEVLALFRGEHFGIACSSGLMDGLKMARVISHFNKLKITPGHDPRTVDK